jgi:cytochrome c peroxidase
VILSAAFVVVAACDHGGSSSDSGSSDSGSTGEVTTTGPTTTSTTATTTTDSTTTTTGGSTGDETGGETTGGEEEWDWGLPENYPEPFVPEDNPMTAAKVELGRHLFYDARLSGNETMSCSSCHEQQYGFADGLAQPTGSTGDLVPRNSMSLTNSAYSFPLTWVAPTLPTLEDQLPVPIFNETPTELGATPFQDEIPLRFADDPLYQELFTAAFPDEADPYTWRSIIQSLACFVRTMISSDSPWDRYTYGGDQNAISDSAKRGRDLFFSEDLECHHCHGNFNFTLGSKDASTVFDPIVWANTGLYNVGGTGDYPATDQGLFGFTGLEQDKGKFRPPTLRNIAVTGPYGHDGSVATLEDMIAIYERGGRNVTSGPNAGDGALNPHKSGFLTGFTLTDQERMDLLAFLNALTDQTFLTDPKFANPFE